MGLVLGEELVVFSNLLSWGTWYARFLRYVRDATKFLSFLCLFISSLFIVANPALSEIIGRVRIFLFPIGYAFSL